MTRRARRLDRNRKYSELYRDRGREQVWSFHQVPLPQVENVSLLNFSPVKSEVLIRALVVSRSASGGGDLSLTCLSCWVDLDVFVSLRPLMISAQGLISAFCPQTLTPNCHLYICFSPSPLQCPCYQSTWIFVLKASSHSGVKFIHF